MKSVLEVTGSQACCGCGSCVSICPSNSLRLVKETKYRLASDGCTSCGRCSSVCPAINDLAAPDVVACYSAYSRNDRIRFDSSSGGFVTQFLIDLLEAGEIEGAIVCDYREDDIFSAQAIVARSRDDLIKASASKYFPVPMNEILRSVGTGRFAFVGLPCHVKSLRLYQRVDRRLSESITLIIGLFCNHTPDFHATDYLLQGFGIRKRDVLKIRYRGDGWPGTVQVSLKNGQVAKISNAWQTGFGKYFMPNVCLACTDVFSENADISAGDPWLKDYESDQMGTSLLIVRSARVDGLLENSSGLVLRSVAHEIVMESQRILYDVKVKRKQRIKRRILYSLGKFRFLWPLLFLLTAKGGSSLRIEETNSFS